MYTKIESLKKSMIAIRAITDCAPWGGGVNADKDILQAYLSMYNVFHRKLKECGLTEAEAWRLLDRQ